MPNWKDEYEMDDDGRMRKRKKGMPRDGERINFSMEMMDHAAGFSRKFSDGTVDHTHWSRPGYRFADSNDPARIAAEEAYQARNRRMADAWKHKGEPQQDDKSARQDLSRTRTLDELRRAADAAYEARNERMRNAWRQRNG